MWEVRLELIDTDNNMVVTGGKGMGVRVVKSKGGQICDKGR